MDVILDSNILTPNFKMKGAEFVSLYDYLNRTNSYLVIPQIVFQETAANHSRLLKERVTAAQRALEQLNGIVFATMFPADLEVDVQREADQQKTRKNVNHV
jgi:hypothetical protein